MRKFLKKLSISSQLTGFQQAGLYRNILGCFFRALIQAAYTMPDLQPDIPEQSHPLFQLMGNGIVLFHSLRPCRWKQYEQIDVGIGKKLLPAITADCQQSKGMVHPHFSPHLAEDSVHQPAMVLKQGSTISGFLITLAQQSACFTQPVFDGLGI
jgi:hypothetical protein